MLFLLVVAVCWSRLFKARFAATRLLPRFGTAGCPLDYRVVVKNLPAKTTSGLTLLENLADPRPSFQEFVARERAEQKSAPFVPLQRQPARELRAGWRQ